MYNIDNVHRRRLALIRNASITLDCLIKYGIISTLESAMRYAAILGASEG